jgi:SAM-dependent methyltransferase
MQERYLVGREERFAVITRLVRETQGEAPRILDLGCGTGSLMAALLGAIPEAQVLGLDLDPTLLPLAEKRLAVFGGRGRVQLADLTRDSWLGSISPWERDGARANAVVSATALHWLSPDQLSRLYAQIAGLLPPGGIFLNADHVASDAPAVQTCWVHHRQEMRAARPGSASDDWDGFWKAYLAALGPEAQAARQEALGDWQGGVEEGMPLTWHLDQLRASGFKAVDCFLRLDCDAVYGGIRI